MASHRAVGVDQDRGDLQRPAGLHHAVTEPLAVAEPAGHFETETVFDGRSAPDGHEGVARVVPGHEDLVIEAAEECPGACIHLEG